MCLLFPSLVGCVWFAAAIPAGSATTPDEPRTIDPVASFDRVRGVPGTRRLTIAADGGRMAARFTMMEPGHPTNPAGASRAARPPDGAGSRLRSLSRFLAWLTFSVAGRVLAAAFFLVAGGALALLILAVAALNRRADLSLWHTVVLREEFRAGCGDRSFADYLAREERLFAELDARIYDGTEAAGPEVVARYRRGSPADPSSFPTNWNRSFELAPADGKPRCGVLMLHGMSDSPYSFRTLGQRLQGEGARVLGLRLPGHGTAPSGLLEMKRRDLDAAVRLAVAHLREQVDDRPVYLVGYSNGGALAVHYALEALEDEVLPRIDGIVLISPSIGVSPMAGLAVWQARIGHWLGLEKLAWNSISPEYDPFKYNSFAVNAGDQVYRLTEEIARHLERLGPTGKLERFPPVLAFQSAVDATVSTPKLIEGFFARLPGEHHELVLFDVNRTGRVESFLARDPRETLRELILSAEKPFTLTVLANRAPDSLALEERRYSLGETRVDVGDPGLAWPEGVYSLSHVALPFPPGDPIYGNGLAPDHAGAGFQIGNVVLRGERGVLQISPAEQLRLRWNPFYDWLEERAVGFVARNREN